MMKIYHIDFTVEFKPKKSAVFFCDVRRPVYERAHF